MNNKGQPQPLVYKVGAWMSEVTKNYNSSNSNSNSTTSSTQNDGRDGLEVVYGGYRGNTNLNVLDRNSEDVTIRLNP